MSEEDGNTFKVSVPLRGKEGEGHHPSRGIADCRRPVSVPLRGKEGEGPWNQAYREAEAELFPSPCGVRRV